MLETAKKAVYTVFGLKLISDIHFPELPQHQQLEVSEDIVDIFIKKSDLSKLWMQLSFSNKKLVVKENLVMFEINNIAIFLIEDGNKILFSPLDGYEEDIVRIYLLGTCMGSLLMQRKVYPLHGSAVVIDEKAYAIVGESGAGKSTLALTFLNNGYQLLSDDVIAVSFSQDGKPHVTPSYPQQKLWQESLKEFGMEHEDYKSIYGRETKYCVPVDSKYYKSPLPLGGIFELEKTDNNQICIERIDKLNRFHTLSTHTYRNYLIPQLGLMEWHFKTSAFILNSIDIFRLQRPSTGFSAPQLASIILDTINREK